VKPIDAAQDWNELIYTDWILIEPQFDPTQLNARETVFTIGNGYLGTRGSFEEGYRGDISATLIHGVYDPIPVMYTELVNCPDWLPLTVLLLDREAPDAPAERFRLDRGEIVHYERRLNLRWGILSRSVRWRSPGGRTLDLHFERFASLADPHVLALRCLVTPVDFDGAIEIQASLNGYAENQGYNHWELLEQGQTAENGTEARMWLHGRTRSSKIELGIASKIALWGTEAPFQVSRVPGYPTISATFAATRGKTVLAEKWVTVATSRDTDDPVEFARSHLDAISPYAQLRRDHKQAWDEVWQASDIEIEGDPKAQLAVRYNLFQLLASAPRNDNRVSIPAKTLSGFGYRGHVFWDTEIFILPFFSFTQPEIARNLLTYRHRTLEGARRKARYYGYKGAMFAWESADSGDEVTPRWALPTDPYGSDVRIWCRDLEVHISADVAYASWQYWQATGDDEWMRDRGAELILDSALFWMSRVEWDSSLERYEIREVIGADEYHDRVNNNALTNRLAQWNLEKAVAVCDWLQQAFPQQWQQLEQRLGLTPERRSRWRDIAANLWIPHDRDTGFIEQAEGFCQLEDIDLSEYEPRSRSMQVILGIEGANKRQVLKQPDVLMLLYLMRQFGESPYTREVLQVNWDYYVPRTDITYGSSLGPAIHAILAADLGKTKTAYDHFTHAALVDLENTRNNADEGIHGASAGAVWQAVIFGFGGIRFAEGKPTATPHLPPGWTRLSFKLHWRGQWYAFDLQPSPETPPLQPIAQPEPPPVPAEPPPLPPLTVRGVIFDLDGVLADTAEYHYRAWQRLADEEGLPFDREANEALRGLSRRESLLRIIGDRQYSEADLQGMMDRKNRYYVESIEAISPADLLPGVLPLLTELRQAGVRVAIGSASKNARTVIDKLGIADWVNAIADGYSVERAKPAPDLFLHAANQLRVPPGECVAIEDAAAGIEAALAGGMRTVGLGPKQRVGMAHVVLPSLTGVSWTNLLVQMSDRAKGKN
jgi:kojibiose phosphorylase